MLYAYARGRSIFSKFNLYIFTTAIMWLIPCETPRTPVHYRFLMRYLPLPQPHDLLSPVRGLPITTWGVCLWGVTPDGLVL